MSATHVRVDYDQLDQMTARFDAEAEQIFALYHSLAHLMDDLMSVGWRGSGADAFYTEMENQVLPTCKMMAEALNETRVTLMRVIAGFQQAEDEAAACFSSMELSGSPDFWGIVRNVSSFGFNMSDIDDLIKEFPEILRGKWKLGTGDVITTLLSGFVGGVIDLGTGEERDIFNAFGKNLTSAGIDLGIMALAGGVPVVTIATLVTEGGSRGGQIGISLSRQINDQMLLDPRVRSELNAGLDYDERVFKGIGELNDTWEGVKNMAWDVIGRPYANDLENSIEHAVKGLQTGQPGEFLQATGHMIEAAVMGPGSMINFLTDQDAQQHLVKDFKSTFEHGWNFALSASQFESAVTRLPLRVGVSAFDNLVNTLPMDPQVRHTLNDLSLGAAKLVNTVQSGNAVVMPDASLWNLPSKIFQ